MRWCTPLRYQCALLTFTLLTVAFIATCIALALTLDPPTARRELVTPAPTQHTQTTQTQPLSTTTSVASSTTVASVTPGITTTPTIIYPVNVTCPANVTIQLGSSLSPTYTGGSPSAAGGCTLPNPIITYVDTTTPLVNTTLLVQSPLDQEQTPLQLGVPSSRISMANGGGTGQVVVAVAGNESAIITIYDATLSTILVPSFPLNTLVPGACNGTSGGGPAVDAQVLWDAPAARWIIAEPTSDHLSLCVYVSLTPDATLGFAPTPSRISLDGYDITRAQLSLWGPSIYSVTLAQSRLCVLDRISLLALAPDPIPYLCADALNGLLPAFSLNAWTPLHVEGATFPVTLSGVGADAVFMRAIDDELQYGANTPTTDQIEVEHWYAINFTAASFAAVRYKIAVADFDSSSALCAAPSICVPTPSIWELDPVREPLMSRLSARPITLSTTSVIATLTSHANGVDIARFYWFDLRLTPTSSVYWTLHQQGVSPTAQDGLHKWLPSPSLDAYGNLVILYAASNVTTWPSLYAVMRLASDFPLGALRNTTLLIRAGDSPSTLTSTQWGPTSIAQSDPIIPRLWYVSGQYSVNGGDPWGVHTGRLDMGEQLVTRNWTAFDYCGSAAWCLQEILGD